MKKEEILRIVEETVDSKIKSFNFQRELFETIRHIVNVEIERKKSNDKENKEKDYALMAIFIKTIKKIFKNMCLIHSSDGEFYELIFESCNGRSKYCLTITEEDFTNLIPFVELRQ